MMETQTISGTDVVELFASQRQTALKLKNQQLRTELPDYSN
jgi:hypothetical protein